MSKSNRKVIGILGGMGPYATIKFMQNIMDETDAEKDWEHVHTVVDNNTRIPSRSRAILYNEESPLHGMINSCKALSRYPVDAIVIPCNSAHYWRNDVQKKIKTPILNMVDIVIEELMKVGCNGAVLVLGSTVIYKSKLYKTPLQSSGLDYIDITQSEEKGVIDFIEAIKRHNTNIKRQERLKFDSLIKRLKTKYKPQAIILACTELSILKNMTSDIPIFDSSGLLAKFVVKYSYGDIELQLNKKVMKKFWEKRALLFEENKMLGNQSIMLTINEADAEKKTKNEKSVILGEIRNFITKDDYVLELGCGLGRWTKELVQLVKSVDAYDFMVSYIQKVTDEFQQLNITNASFFCEEIGQIRLTKQYTCFASFGLLMHLNQMQLNHINGLLENHLEIGGVYILKDSFGIEKRFQLQGYYSDVIKEPYYAVYRTVDELIDTFSSKFSILVNKVVLPPQEGKSETCQRLLVLRKEE